MVEWQIRVTEGDGVNPDKFIHKITAHKCNEKDWKKLNKPTGKDAV